MSSLIGPFGPVKIRTWERGGLDFMGCAKLGCEWFIEHSYLALHEALEMAVTHECGAPWRGFERYTIRPERPKGRRL